LKRLAVLRAKGLKQPPLPNQNWITQTVKFSQRKNLDHREKRKVHSAPGSNILAVFIAASKSALSFRLQDAQFSDIVGDEPASNYRTRLVRSGSQADL